MNDPKLKIYSLGCVICFFFRCSTGSAHAHHIGLVANFTESNGCLPKECTIVGSSAGETKYICTGCRHRWRWLDGSQPTGYHRWADDQPSLYAVARAHCVVLRKDEWLTIECDDIMGFYICKQGTSYVQILMI